jgi:UDP-N-acetylmuramoylalanine--D-glutamate ligase
MGKTNLAKLEQNKYRGIKVVVMGLGLHGGGLESARYLARRGAQVTVTDLRDEAALAPSLEALRNFEGDSAQNPAGISFRYVLGRHDMADFENADMVIKNPGVKPDSPFLQIGCRVETDISLFLSENPARLTAVTGSKGKSSTASAIHWVLRHAREQKLLPGAAYLGGNITVSPLTFLDNLTAEDDVVLELSSWQLGDLKGRLRAPGSPEALLKPRCAVLTAIMSDHQDRYGSMEAYVADKRIIYQGQDSADATIAGDDPWGRSFLAESRGRPLVYADTPLPPGVAGGWLAGNGPAYARLPARAAGPTGTGEAGSIALTEPVEAVPAALLTPGLHQKKNLLAAALALLDMGLDPGFVRESLGAFPGIEHRLEYFHEARGIRFYNDTAATIPEAAAAAIATFTENLVLVTGGADKNLDFGCLVQAAAEAHAAGRLRSLILLAGSGSVKLKPLLDAAAIPVQGPFDSVDAAVRAALDAAVPGDAVVLSPGCASFGMFQNEFDRGRKWKEAVRRLATGN